MATIDHGSLAYILVDLEPDLGGMHVEAIVGKLMSCGDFSHRARYAYIDGDSKKSNMRGGSASYGHQNYPQNL